MCAAAGAKILKRGVKEVVKAIRKGDSGYVKELSLFFRAPRVHTESIAAANVTVIAVTPSLFAAQPVRLGG